MKSTTYISHGNDSLNWHYEVDKKDIAYLTGIFEAYDDLAILRTLNQNRGLIELLISPDYVDEVKLLVEGLQKELPIRKLP